MSLPTKADLDHLTHIQSEVTDLIESKYLGGIREHGGHLWEKPTDIEAMAEVADLACYMVTTRDQIDEVCRLAREALDADDDRDAGKTACLHILETLGRVTEETNGRSI